MEVPLFVRMVVITAAGVTVYLLVTWSVSWVRKVLSAYRLTKSREAAVDYALVWLSGAHPELEPYADSATFTVEKIGSRFYVLLVIGSVTEGEVHFFGLAVSLENASVESAHHSKILTDALDVTSPTEGQ
jgi:hypothetical protein